MKLFFSRNPNPRLAVAVARCLDANIEFEFASPLAPGEAERFLPLNPNLLLPILSDSGKAFGRPMQLPASFRASDVRISGAPATTNLR